MNSRSLGIFWYVGGHTCARACTHIYACINMHAYLCVWWCTCVQVSIFVCPCMREEESIIHNLGRDGCCVNVLKRVMWLMVQHLLGSLFTDYSTLIVQNVCFYSQLCHWSIHCTQNTNKNLATSADTQGLWSDLWNHAGHRWVQTYLPSQSKPPPIPTASRLQPSSSPKLKRP